MYLALDHRYLEWILLESPRLKVAVAVMVVDCRGDGEVGEASRRWQHPSL